MAPLLSPSTTLFFLCDIQTRFKNAIHGYDQVVATAGKLVRLAKIFGCEVVATTQSARALGPIDPQIDTNSLGPLYLGPFDKTHFSMITQEVESVLDARPRITSVVVFGIESHICVLQTALSLATRQIPLVPYIPLDGISSCNYFEVGVAIARMRQAGAIITTSESLTFELMGDAGLDNFREFNRIIKEEKENTKNAGEILISGRQAATAPGKGEVTGGVILADKSSL